MQNRQLQVLIVSRYGAHQKAIKTICASIPAVSSIEIAPNTQLALEMLRNNRPDLIIMGANLSEEQVCELLDQVKNLPKPPYFVALTLSEFASCFDHHLEPDQIISTKSFGVRIPEILNEVYVNVS